MNGTEWNAKARRRGEDTDLGTYADWRDAITALMSGASTAYGSPMRGTHPAMEFTLGQLSAIRDHGTPDRMVWVTDAGNGIELFATPTR